MAQNMPVYANDLYIETVQQTLAQCSISACQTQPGNGVVYRAGPFSDLLMPEILPQLPQYCSDEAKVTQCFKCSDNRDCSLANQCKLRPPCMRLHAEGQTEV